MESISIRDDVIECFLTTLRRFGMYLGGPGDRSGLSTKELEVLIKRAAVTATVARLYGHGGTDEMTVVDDEGVPLDVSQELRLQIHSEASLAAESLVAVLNRRPPLTPSES